MKALYLPFKLAPTVLHGHGGVKMLPQRLQQFLSIYIQKIQIETGIALLIVKGTNPEAALASIARARTAADDLKARLLAEETEIMTWEREENQWGDGSAWNRLMVECNPPLGKRSKSSVGYAAPWSASLPVDASSRALALLAELAFILPIARSLDQERGATLTEDSEPSSLHNLLPHYSDALALLYTRLHTEVYGHGESFLPEG